MVTPDDWFRPDLASGLKEQYRAALWVCYGQYLEKPEK